MSQTLQVLLCVNCKIFQVQIVKKSSNKWNCKVCDSKQSVQQVYAKGTGVECRDIVKRLNEARGKREDNLNYKALSSVAQVEQQTCSYFSNDNDNLYDDQAGNTSTSASQVPTTCYNSVIGNSGVRCVPPEESKWTVFLDDN